MQIPFVGPTYNGRSFAVDSSRSINFFPEINQESNKASALIGTSGTRLWKRFGTKPIRAMYRFANYLFVVCGTELFRVDNKGSVTTVGELNTNTGYISFSDNGVSAQGVGGDQMTIIDSTYGYVYNVRDNSLVGHPSPNFPSPVKAVAYMDGYTIASSGNMGITVSELYDASTYNGLAIAAAIATPDNISSIVNLHQQLFIIKEYSTEVWYNTGTATQDGCPFARVSGAVIDYGTLAPYSVARGNNSIYFLANQRIGDGSGSFVGVVELNGYTPQLITPPSIIYQMSKYTVEDSFAFCYLQEGHLFYQITFPSDNVTFVYDAATKMWHERSTYTGKGEVTFDEDGNPTPRIDIPKVTNRHLASCYSFFGGKHLVGDYRTGNVYEMSSEFYNDNSEPIISTRITPIVFDPNDNLNVFTSKIIVTGESGVGDDSYYANPSGIGELLDGSFFLDGLTYLGSTIEITTAGDPQARLSWSDDSGKTWSNEYPASMGRIGEYSSRMVWRRLGFAKNRVYKLKISSAVKKVITGAMIEVSV